jgi:hypothetical protein
MKSEAELAACVIAYLTTEQWDVYQEVPTQMGLADIVAVRGKCAMIVETKLQLSFKLVTQIMYRRFAANWACIACPGTKDSDTNAGVAHFCRTAGIGWLRVDADREVQYEVRPVFHRMRGQKNLVHRLCPEHKTYAAAGSPGGSHWSPYKQTCRHVLNYVTQHPGASAKEVVESVQHHWSDLSARHTLLDFVKRGLVPQVRIRYEGRHVKLYTTQQLGDMDRVLFRL